MKEIQFWLFILLSTKSTLTWSVARREEVNEGESNTSSDYRRQLSQALTPLSVKNAAIISENETSELTTFSGLEFDNNALENQSTNPSTDKTSDSTGSDDALIVEGTSTVDTPVKAALTQNNSEVTLGRRCSFSLKCSGQHVECIQGICGCTTGFEEHQDVCLEAGTFARVREPCNETNRCLGQFTMCNRGICSCYDGYVYSSEKFGSCIARNLHHHVDVSKTDPTMIGVVIGLALMSVTLCVVMRLFAKARFRENRTIFNTANPRLMNVTLKKGSKHGGNRGRRGSQISVRSGECGEDLQQNERYADNGVPEVPVKESAVSGAATTA